METMTNLFILLLALGSLSALFLLLAAIEIVLNVLFPNWNK